MATPDLKSTELKLDPDKLYLEEVFTARRIDPHRVRDRRRVARGGCGKVRTGRKRCDRPYRARAAGAAPPGELLDRRSTRPLGWRRQDPAAVTGFYLRR